MVEMTIVSDLHPIMLKIRFEWMKFCLWSRCKIKKDIKYEAILFKNQIKLKVDTIEKEKGEI